MTGQAVPDFAALMRLLRTEARLTQEELAEAAGLNPRSVSDLERGIHQTARKATAGLLADVFGLTGQVRVRFVQAARGLAPAMEVVAARENALAKAARSSALTVRYCLPPDAAAFTGRDEELDQIAAAVRAAAGAGRVLAIEGMPGVGKTALAVHAAHLLRHRFPDRQLFIDLHAHTPGREPVSPADALAGLLTAAGVEARYLPEGVQSRTALWRDSMAGQRAVLVLDNAASSGQVAPLLPGGEGCLVLVTSRRHLGDLPGTVVGVSVEILPSDQAEAMFLRLAPRAGAGQAAAVAELLRLAGFLPLAISLLARVYARHPRWTLADLTAETRASMLTLAAENNSVAAAFDVSYRYLAPDQQRFLGRLGLHPGATIDAYAAAALTGTSLSEAGRHLDALHGEALLTEAGYRRYGMHDLIRRYAQDRTVADPAAGRNRALDRLLDFYTHTAAIAESRLARQTSTRPAPDLATTPAAVPDLRDSTQALAWLRAERANLLACLDHVTVTGQHARVVALTAGTAALLQRDGPWTDAIARHTTAAEAAQLSGDRLGQANTTCNLGVVWRQTGDYPDATRAQEEALGIYRSLGSRLGQANTLTELGSVWRQTGDYLAAARASGEALDIFRDLGSRLGEANALTDLGALRRQTGDYLAAAQPLEEALDIFRDLGSRLGQANALTEIGGIRRCTGDYLGAAQPLEEALGIYRDLGSRLGQANALNNLGSVRGQLGDYLGAAQPLEEALGIYRDLGSRLGQANALNNLGSVRGQLGDYPGAAQALAEALGICRDLGDRGGEVEVLNEAGTLQRARGDLEQARGYHRQALNLARKISSFWDEAHALAGLGRCALAGGHTADAAVGLRQARQIFQRIGAAEAAGVAAELDTLSKSHPAATPQPAAQALPGCAAIQLDR
jgi:tetratricopeptide (TPR) repeat protein/transcriptional regulator with XRE-family HTH domain